MPNTASLSEQNLSGECMNRDERLYGKPILKDRYSLEDMSDSEASMRKIDAGQVLTSHHHQLLCKHDHRDMGRVTR